MAVKPVIVGQICTNCYLVFDDTKKEGVVIDPGDECFKILRLVDKYGVKIKSIVLTHGHFDHCGAAMELSMKTNAKIFVHEADASMLGNPVLNGSALFTGVGFAVQPGGLLSEGDTVRAGELELKVIHTPGHTKGGISLAMGSLIFTGDTLFCGGLGRTDLPSSSHGEIMDSIKNKLLKYPDGTEIYPGHGYMSTIGEERKLYH